MSTEPEVTGAELTADLQAAVRTIAAASDLLVCSDFDGTLAPIVLDPAAARALPEGVDALVTLAALPRTVVAVVSGRSRNDLAARCVLPAQVHLVGSHGAELGPADSAPLDAAAGRLLAQLLESVRTVVAGVPGVRLEGKPAGVAVHVRGASRPDADAVLGALRRGPGSWGGVFALAGHEVLELSVVDADKGHAVDVLRSRSGARAVLYLGDDRTDEHAFARLAGPDVGVKVGAGPTLAAYRVAGPPQVAALLALLARERGGPRRRR